jgi:farnesyl diphosphate synthase
LTDFKQTMTNIADAVTELIDDLLERTKGPENQLIEAMRYSSLNGGKRVRPFLVVATADLFGVARTQSLRTAVAIEMVHCYSLIHDDLPAMDNDTLRRGIPTLHIKFDEATAILAGDALLTKAFEVLAAPETHSDSAVRSDLCLALAKASGERGMVGGQMLDLIAENKDLAFDLRAVTQLQRMKTGKLISVSCEAGCLLGKASLEAHSLLKAYSDNVGLAFQITDDLLDVEGSAEEVGKAIGKDDAAGKSTFVSLLGASSARNHANLLSEQAVEHLDFFGEKAVLLQNLARFIVNRKL